MTIKSATRTDLEPGMVALIGAPSDANSTYLRGAARGPTAIRRALHCPSSNLCAENGLDLGTDGRLRDLGDLDLPDSGGDLASIEQGLSGVLETGARVLTLGGDHAISHPVLRAHAKHHADLTILHLDAHPDLYDSFEGNRQSHACPFARIMEEKLARRLVQVGIRTMNPHQREQAKRFGVEVVEMRACRSDLELRLDGPVYLSLDLDVLDPAFAPGVSHHEPGGMSTRDVIRLIQSISSTLVGADVVELNPDRDVQEMTAMVAAKLVKEIAALMLESR